HTRFSRDWSSDVCSSDLSVSLVEAQDAGAIVITGSHGGLQGDDPVTAIGGHAVFAAAYNDAGIGADGAGTSRLPALERQGVAGEIGRASCRDSMCNPADH